jgi:DNA-binding transcriptional MerR regulator
MNIQAVSKLTGLSAHTLRYYEKIDLLLNIERDSKGYRDYSERDLVWIEFIKRLKATNMPLNEIKKFALLRSKGDSTINDRLEILQNHQSRVKRQMNDLLIHQKKIKEKIEICRKGGELKTPEKSP